MRQSRNIIILVNVLITNLLFCKMLLTSVSVSVSLFHQSIKKDIVIHTSCKHEYVNNTSIKLRYIAMAGSSQKGSDPYKRLT